MCCGGEGGCVRVGERDVCGGVEGRVWGSRRTGTGESKDVYALLGW